MNLLCVVSKVNSIVEVCIISVDFVGARYQKKLLQLVMGRTEEMLSITISRSYLLRSLASICVLHTSILIFIYRRYPLLIALKQIQQVDF